MSAPAERTPHLKKQNMIQNPVSLLMSPMKKRPRKADLTSNDKIRALNIYNYVEKSTPTYPVKMEILKTTAKIMGTSEITIRRILR